MGISVHTHICEFYSGLTLETLLLRLRVSMAPIKDEIAIKLCMVDLVDPW